MKLYELKRGDKIKVDEGLITFDHIDGMYSYCTVDWSHTNGTDSVIHLAASTELAKVGDNYEIV